MGPSRSTTGRPRVGNDPQSGRFFRLAKFRKLRGSEQVAAVCYRVSKSAVEFLLVQTRGGRWTFPKGSVEPGLTHAQSAALEAFEEAGVHGRMEESSFTCYLRRPGNRRSPSGAGDLAVGAHLCEVLRLEPPQECKRHPTWFSAEKAKRRLRQDRTLEDGAELTRVVDRALIRIRRLRRPTGVAGPSQTPRGLQPAGQRLERGQTDALQRVQFEAFPEAGAYGKGGARPSTAMELAVKAFLSKLLRQSEILRLGPAQSFEGDLAWSSAEKADALEKLQVQEVDDPRRGRGRPRESSKPLPN
jgi:8-oxo-dGTP pyrophosphatase MutT (NUDIX family)